MIRLNYLTKKKKKEYVLISLKQEMNISIFSMLSDGHMLYVNLINI